VEPGTEVVGRTALRSSDSEGALINGSPQQDTLPKFKLADLDIGDILFCTDPVSYESKAIRTTTRSPFSHVAIYKGEMNFLEAADYGVINFNFMRFGIRSKSNVAVYRLKRTVPSFSFIATRAAAAADRYRELEYWTPGAILSAFKTLRRLTHRTGFWLPAREKGFFCSYLVAQSYADGGICLCPGLAPHEINPGDLLNSPHLANISETAIADLPNWDRRTDIIDGAGRETPFQRFTTARQQILQEIQNLMLGLGLPKPAKLDDVLELVILDENADRRKHLDAVVSTCLKARSFTTLPLASTSEVDPPERGAINGVSYAKIPLTVLKSSLDLNYALRRKWEARLTDLREERTATAQIQQQLGLELLKIWDRYNSNMEMALQIAIEELDNSIREITEQIAMRPPC
jgi:hypothetical protein